MLWLFLFWPYRSCMRPVDPPRGHAEILRVEIQPDESPLQSFRHDAHCAGAGEWVQTSGRDWWQVVGAGWMPASCFAISSQIITTRIHVSAFILCSFYSPWIARNGSPLRMEPIIHIHFPDPRTSALRLHNIEAIHEFIRDIFWVK